MKKDHHIALEVALISYCFATALFGEFIFQSATATFLVLAVGIIGAVAVFRLRP